MRDKQLPSRDAENRKKKEDREKDNEGRQDLSERLYKFALDIVEFVKSLKRDWVASEIGKQLLHSGTSVAANYEEARGAFSKKEFVYKLSIAFREAKEANYWLRLLYDAKIAQGPRIEYLLQESKEIRNILGRSVKTARGKNK